jgi:2-dehydro-3-deoxyphosphogluconate aldolase/(4S)-4-hydroxy-2-oxoglutarate aldolase
MSVLPATLSLDELVALAPVIPVVVVEDLADAVPLARALVAGGLPAIEITLRTPVAVAAIKQIAEDVQGAVVGAGTVVAAAQVESVLEAGAEFLVSPGSTPALLDAIASSGVPFLPGVCTPSEVIGLLEREVTVAKLFPAGAIGGVPMLRALAGPFAGVRFCPTGGIDQASAAEYLALPNVCCVGGSWMVPAEAVHEADWARIERLARAAAGLRWAPS